MAQGPFVDDITLNDTVLPNSPNSIKIANTILTDSRIRRCLIELDSMVDDGSSTTVGTVLTSLSDAEDNITALQTNKADSATVTALTTTVNDTATDLADHTQDTTSKRHINIVAGTDDYYLAYDSTMANGTNNVWKQLPASQSTPPMVFELKTGSFTATANYF